MISPQIKIEQQFSKLGLNVKEPQISIKKKINIFKLRKEKANLKINQKKDKLEVDNYPAEYDLGYRNYKDFAKDVVAKGEQAALQATRNYAQNGDQYTQFKKFDVVDIVKQDLQKNKREINIKFKRGPKVSYKAGDVSIKYKPGKVYLQTRLDNEVNKPEIKMQYGSVKSYLRQRNSINISV